MQGCGPICTPAWFYCLVRALVLVDIDIFGVDYVVRFLLLLRAGGRSTTCSGACSRRSGLRRARCLVSLVQHLSNLVQLARSEEHTSELQSLAYLVCRLLLEKKKINHQILARRHVNKPVQTHS